MRKTAGWGSIWIPLRLAQPGKGPLHDFAVVLVTTRFSEPPAGTEALLVGILTLAKPRDWFENS